MNIEQPEGKEVPSMLLAMVNSSEEKHDCYPRGRGDGSGVHFYTVGYAIKSVAEAENKKKEAARQVLSIGGGIIGAKYGAEIGVFVGPLGAFVMAVIGGLLGGFAGNYLGSAIAELLFHDEEVEVDNYAE